MPVITLRPTGSAIRAGLRTATLLGNQRRLEEAPLAVVLVEVPTLRDTQRRSPARQSREELRLTVHRFLVQETQRIQATVSPMGDQRPQKPCTERSWIRGDCESWTAR